MLRMVVPLALLAFVPFFAVAPAAACPHDGCMSISEYVAVGLSAPVVGPVLSGYRCLSDDCSHGGKGLGGARFAADGRYSNVVFSLHDDVYGGAAANWVCVVATGPSDGACDRAGPVVCGRSHVLADQPIAHVTVHVLWLHVDEALGTCGGTTGTATADFF